MVEGLGSCSRWKFIHFMHFHFVFIRPGSGKRLKLQRTFVRFWGFESIIWKSESTLGCSLESGWSAYEVELGGQSPANIFIKGFSSNTNTNTNTSRKNGDILHILHLLRRGFTLLFRLFRFDFDKRLVGGSLCPVCPERTDSLSIFTQLRENTQLYVRNVF